MCCRVKLNIAVLGAGVVGLTTALLLQKEFPEAKITVIAEKFGEDTTSAVAAGLFLPLEGFSASDSSLTSNWVHDSYNFWKEILDSGEEGTGTGPACGLILLDKYPKLPNDNVQMMPGYRRATEEELNMYPGNWKYGYFLNSIQIKCTYYLPWALRLFKGELKTEKIESFEQIDSKYTVVMNCTGLGSKFLCNDEKLVPIRGQIIKVRAPWIKNFIFTDYETYIIPAIDGTVTLGGCRHYDSFKLSADKYDRESIEERTRKLCPDLIKAEVIGDRVGLRPHRDPVRVEKEIMKLSDGRILRVVHNYGHGGSGVTTAPGTVINAIKLLKEMLPEPFKHN